MACKCSKPKPNDGTNETPKANSKFVVASIDIGTTYLGYAYSFCHQPQHIFTNHWRAGLSQPVSEKNPTSVLFHKDEFHSVGYEAEEEHAKIVGRGEDKDWFLFSNFKMSLYSHDLRRDKEIKDFSGRKSMKVMALFSAYIRFLKTDLLERCKRKSADVKENDIFWVLTVPAIWGQAAKEFMMEAALLAGIDRKSCIIGLEPECATIHLTRGCEKEATSPIGNNVMVVDAGGGTVDITVASKSTQFSKADDLKVVYQSNGGPWGGNKVSEKFQKLVEDIFGNHVMENVPLESKLEIKQEIELKKRKPDSCMLKIPGEVQECFKKENDVRDISEHIAQMSKYKDDISFRRGKLDIRKHAFEECFSSTIADIVEHIKTVVQALRGRLTLSSICLVGGFANCELLFNAIKEKFGSKIDVSVPGAPEMAVLKGAVLFGHDPGFFKERICRYTIGTDCMMPFEAGKDFEELAWVGENGVKYCRKRFAVHATIEQSVSHDEFITVQTYEVQPHQRTVSFGIYCSESKSPRYIINPDVMDTHKIGELNMTLPEKLMHRWFRSVPRTIEIKMKFGDTMLKVQAKDSESGEIIETSLNSLH